MAALMTSRPVRSVRSAARRFRSRTRRGPSPAQVAGGVAIAAGLTSALLYAADRSGALDAGAAWRQRRRARFTRWLSTAASVAFTAAGLASMFLDPVRRARFRATLRAVPGRPHTPAAPAAPSRRQARVERIIIRI